MNNNKAIILAKLAQDDKTDMQDCVRDLMANNKVDKDTAIKVAVSLRNKYMPRVAEELDISLDEALDVVSNNVYDLNFDQMKSEDRNNNENGINFPNDRNNDTVDEIGVKDDSHAINAASSSGLRTAVEEALQDKSFAKFAKIEDDFESQEDLGELSNIINENETSAQMINQGSVNELLNKRGETNMTPRELNARKAKRDKLVREANDLLNASTKSFEHAESAQMYKGNDYPTMSLKEDSGNTLGGATKDFAKSVSKTVVPTTNSADKDLQLHEDYDIFHFDGTKSGGLEYTLSSELFGFDVPSAGENIGEDFAVPTQLPKLTRKTTIAQDENDSHEFEPVMDEEDDDESYNMKDHMKGLIPPDSMGSMDEESMPPEDEELDISSEPMDEDGEGDFLPTDDTEDISLEDGMPGEASEGEDYTPADAMDLVESFDDEQLQEFLDTFKGWAQENGLSLSESVGDDSKNRESIASILGPNFDLDKAENLLYNDLIASGVDDADLSNLTYAQAIDLYDSIKTAQVGEAKITTPVREMTLKASEDGEEDTDEYITTKDMKKNKPCVGAGCEEVKEATEIAQLEKAAQVKEARIKVAFDIWSRLAMNGVVEINDVAEYANGWIEEGLSTKAMINQGDVMLKTAANAMRKTASKTESSNALATTPAFTSFNTGKPQAMDLKSALSGLFTCPQIDES
jgi:hypothetical protein